MKLRQLTIANVRLFGEPEQNLHLDTEKNIIIILGDNGSGKTTLLDTVNILLSSYTSAFPGKSMKMFSEWDVHTDGVRKMADYLTAIADIKVDGVDNYIPIKRYRAGSKKSPKSDVAEIKNYGETLRERINEGKEVELPVIAYYSTGRGQIEAPERKRNFQKIFNRWDCYDNVHEANTNFKRFFAWFDLMEDEERREQGHLRDFDYKNPVLEAVRTAVERMVDNFKRPRIETRPLRFVVDQIMPDGSKKELRIEQLSDGYKIAIAMVADIAARMAEANPQKEYPLLTPGIILIDEIDLHLHPQWQRKILKSLHSIFPNVQFIVTTHSPSVILGALEIAQIIKAENGKFSIEETTEKYHNYDVSRLLLSDLFELENVRTDQYLELLKQRIKLAKKPEMTEEELAEKGVIDTLLANYTSVNVEDLKKVILELKPCER